MYEEENVHSPDSVSDNDRFAEIIISESEKFKPMISEQLLRNCILGIDDVNENINIYCQAFGRKTSQEITLVILRPFRANDFEDFFYIRNIAQQYMEKRNLLLNAIMNDFIVIATTVTDRGNLHSSLEKVCGAIRGCYDLNVMAVYSRTVTLADMPAAYERLRTMIGYSFYSKSGGVICEDDVAINTSENISPADYSSVEDAVRGGDVGRIKILLKDFFKKLTEQCPVPAVAKTYCLELYVCIIRCCSIEKIERYMQGIVFIQDTKFLKDIQSFIEECAVEITGVNAPEQKKIYSSLIRDTIKIIDDNIENENLSLRWLAGNILYTNVDYLGKLFKKETGKNFSHYVMEKRMEKAKYLIIEGKKDRIYEIAENVGYGNNSQYFSQVFKKYTGISPLEYKEFVKMSRQNKSAANNS